MVIRVYPAWDRPISKQAIATQKWQLGYFVETSEDQEAVKERLTELYGGKFKC